MLSMKRAFYAVLIAIFIAALRQYLKGGWCYSSARIDGQIVIITGANTGIGKETAVDLARRGGKIILACRSPERAIEAANYVKKEAEVNDDKVKVMQLDLSSFESVKRFSENFKKEENQLHILINNAGIIFPNHTITADGYELTFQTNHLGHFLLTHLLMDVLKESAPSRVVTVSSLGHSLVSTYDFNAHNSTSDNYGYFYAYANSKLANILFSKELAKNLEGTGVTTYSLHPGSIVTDIGRNIWIGKIPGFKYLTSFFLKDSVDGAQTTICCAVDPQLAQKSGLYYSDCLEKEPTAGAQDDNDAKTLWDLSMQLIGE